MQKIRLFIFQAFLFALMIHFVSCSKSRKFQITNYTGSEMDSLIVLPNSLSPGKYVKIKPGQTIDYFTSTVNKNIHTVPQLKYKIKDSVVNKALILYTDENDEPAVTEIHVFNDSLIIKTSNGRR